jgi:anti-sigma B factor antagonist
MPDQSFPAVWSGQTAVVGGAAEIDVTNADGFREALLSALDGGAQALVVNLSGTTFIDSSGVSALVRASRRAAASGAAVRLVVTTAPVLRVLSLIGVDQLIEVFPSLPAAMASLPASGSDLPA